jgi:type IV pilus assembly protein PilM
MPFFSNKKIKAFGLCITDSKVSVVELEKKADGYGVRTAGSVPLGNRIIVNNAIADETRLAENIRRAMVEAGKLDTNYVVASVPEGKAYVRTLTLPKMGAEEIEGAIPWELEQDIPIPIDQVYLDWQVVNDTAPDKTEVLVMAAPKDYIDDLVTALRMAKLTPVAFELESQATARALIGKEEGSQSVLVLDIAQSHTSFIIVEDRNVHYTSSIPVGEAAFTESIVRTLSVPAAEAEKLVTTVGLVADTKNANIRQPLLPILDNIVDEVKNVVRFYEEHSPARTISRIFLCGPGAKLLGIDEYVSARLNLGSGKSFGRVELGNPWASVVTDPNAPLPVSKQQFSEYATAVGLALRGMEV